MAISFSPGYDPIQPISFGDRATQGIKPRSQKSILFDSPFSSQGADESYVGKERSWEGGERDIEQASWDPSTRESISSSGSGFFSPDGAINFARDFAVANAPDNLRDEVSESVRTFETPFRRDEPTTAETRNTIDRAVTEDPTRGVSRTVETGEIKRPERPVYTPNRATQGISSRSTQETATRPTVPSGQATQGIGGSVAPTVARATQGIGAWYNKGRNVRIPNESTAGWRELWRDDRSQLGKSDANFQSGKKGNPFGRPDQAFNPFRSAEKGGPGSGPTPLVRQVGERILGPVATGASIFAQGQEGSALDQTVRTAAENQISWLPSSDARQNEGDIGRRAGEFIARQAGNARDWFVDKMGYVRKGVTKDESGQATGFGTGVPETYWEGGRQFEVQPEVRGGIKDGQWDPNALVAPEGRTEITDPWSMENLQSKGLLDDGTLIASSLSGGSYGGYFDLGNRGYISPSQGQKMLNNPGAFNATDKELRIIRENLGLPQASLSGGEDVQIASVGDLTGLLSEDSGKESGLLSQAELREKYGDPNPYGGYTPGSVKWETDADGRKYIMKPNIEWTQEGNHFYKDWDKVYMDEQEQPIVANFGPEFGTGDPVETPYGNLTGDWTQPQLDNLTGSSEKSRELVNEFAGKGFLDNYVNIQSEYKDLGEDDWKSELPGWISSPTMRPDGSVWGYNYSGEYGNVYRGGDLDAKHMGQKEGTWGFKPEKDVDVPIPWGDKSGSEFDVGGASKNVTDGDLPSMDQLQSGEGYIKNEDTGEVTKVGGSKPGGINTGTTTDLNPQSSQSSQPTARQHNKNQGGSWTSGFYRTKSVDDIMKDGYSQSEANQIKSHISEGDRLQLEADSMNSQVSSAYKEYQSKQARAAAITVTDQDSYGDWLTANNAADAAYSRYDSLQNQQTNKNSAVISHNKQLSQYL